MVEEYRRIPGYPSYSVTCTGIVKSVVRDIILSQYLFNGYVIVDCFRDSMTETLPVHRAVALAWMENPDPEHRIVVNHIDGVKLNNDYRNLEWVTVSENNYHAVNNGLRKDNIPCKIRDFYTGEVIHFPSRMQAAAFMGVHATTLQPKSFGMLLDKRYEFKCKDDNSPWFYEDRKTIIQPSRYKVIARSQDGIETEYFKAKELLKAFQLYDSPSRSMAGLAEYGNKKVKGYRFILIDSLLEPTFKIDRGVKPTTPISIVAVRKREDETEETLEFRSLTSCATFFKVDRSSIKSRLNNGITLCGWTFTKASLGSNAQ